MREEFQKDLPYSDYWQSILFCLEQPLIFVSVIFFFSFTTQKRSDVYGGEVPLRLPHRTVERTQIQR